MIRRIFLLIAGLAFLLACNKQQPGEVDGNFTFQAVVADESGLIPVDAELGYAPVANAQVVLESKTYYENTTTPKRITAETDNRGCVEVAGLAGGEYVVTVDKELKVEGTPQPIHLRANKIVELYETSARMDTIFSQLPALSNIVINEIYYAGPQNKSHYFYDQFVELYNRSDSTVYLDGLILCRGRQYHNPLMDSLDYVQVLYVYQFPGEPLVGREYPLAAHQFAVVAMDAFDHSKYIDTALDLSTADWEFYNPYASDVDNPAPNVVNAIPENSTDFMINLVHNFVILADGTGYYYGEVSEHDYQYIHVPIRTILDGVEYSANSTSRKELTTRVDAGFAGVGISKYSGKAVERRSPGFDTNNSNLDFVNIDHPTPGYQHE